MLLSDLHLDNRFLPRAALGEIVDAVNAVRGVSAVLMPGDFVGHDLRPLEWCGAEFVRFEAPTFATLGNHDAMFDGGAPIRAALERSGVRVLVNEAVALDAGIWIGGLDETAFGRPDAPAMERHLPTGAPCVVLGHQPLLATSHEQVLHVAGHTHHGQIRLPGLSWRYLPPHSQPYPEGLYEVPRCDGSVRWVYTTAGIGSTTLPLRVGCPPEIVVIDT